MKERSIKIATSKDKEFQLKSTVVAKINPDNCVNCGKCSEYCPVEAIEEKQKEICRLCPDCTEKPALSINKIEEMGNNACTLACPLGISPQGYINLFKNGKDFEAFKIIWDKNPLPLVSGYICHHPCEEECKRGILVDRPLEIRGLKRFLGEKYINWKQDKYPVKNEEKIAIIGGGPAGLTAAHYLSSKGYKVTIFEQSSEPGGMLLRGIPDFRLDKEIVKKEINRIENAGVEIVTNTLIGNDKQINELLKKYDRIIISTGTQVSKKLLIEGWWNEKVLYAVDMMEKVNIGQEVKLSGTVVVIGGGSVAADTARTAKRLGAEEVIMMCLESGDQIPAHKWELEEAKEEGIDIIEGVSPQKFIGHSSYIEGIEIADIENFSIENGLSFDIVPNTSRIIKADYSIIAIGQESARKWEKNDKVYFAGDISNSKCSVIDAMASGRQAAIEIDNDLRERQYQDYEVERSVSLGDKRYKIYPAVRKKLKFPEMSKLDAEERITSFDIVEKGFNEEEARLETFRCLECGYRYVDVEKCIGCGVCSKVCPQGSAITMVSINEEVK